MITVNTKGLITTVTTQDIPSASTSAKGLVQLNDTLTSTSTTQALTAEQGKVLGDRTQQATTTNVGISRFADNGEVASKSNSNVAINPSNAATIAQSTDLGVGQIWQNVSGSRASGVTYTNNTGKPIQVSVCVYHDEQVVSTLSVSGVVVSRVRQEVGGATGYQESTHTAIVPNWATYSVTGGSLISWAELR